MENLSAPSGTVAAQNIKLLRLSIDDSRGIKANVSGTLANNLETCQVYRGGERTQFMSIVRGRFFQIPYGFLKITFSPIANKSEQKSSEE